MASDPISPSDIRYLSTKDSIMDSIPGVLQPPSLTLSGQVVGCEPAVLQDVASVIGPGGPLVCLG